MLFKLTVLIWEEATIVYKTISLLVFIFSPLALSQTQSYQSALVCVGGDSKRFGIEEKPNGICANAVLRSSKERELSNFDLKFNHDNPHFDKNDFTPYDASTLEKSFLPKRFGGYTPKQLCKIIGPIVQPGFSFYGVKSKKGIELKIIRSHNRYSELINKSKYLDTVHCEAKELVQDEYVKNAINF